MSCANKGRSASLPPPLQLPLPLSLLLSCLTSALSFTLPYPLFSPLFRTSKHFKSHLLKTFSRTTTKGLPPTSPPSPAAVASFLLLLSRLALIICQRQSQRIASLSCPSSASSLMMFKLIRSQSRVYCCCRFGLPKAAAYQIVCSIMLTSREKDRERERDRERFTTDNPHGISRQTRSG